MYSMISKKPNIAHSVEVVSGFMSKPGEEYWKVVKWIMRYIQNSINVSLKFTKKTFILEGFNDVEM